MVAGAQQARVMSSEHFSVNGTPVDAGELVRLARRCALVGERAVRCVQRFDSRATRSSSCSSPMNTEAESLTYHLRSADCRSRKCWAREADAARILEEALSLAADQQASVAHELIERLDGDVGAERALQVEAIRAALVEGEQSGIAEDSSLEGILAELRASRAREQTGLLP